MNQNLRIAIGVVVAAVLLAVTLVMCSCTSTRVAGNETAQVKAQIARTQDEVKSAQDSNVKIQSNLDKTDRKQMLIRRYWQLKGKP